MRPYLLPIICVITLLSSCDWVNDDLSGCPTGTWLKISYTYNILDVDAASSQVGDITILAFDRNDKYVDRLDVDSIELHRNYCMVKVPFPEGTYHLIVWGGIYGEDYRLPNLVAGTTERKPLLLSLVCQNGNQYNSKLKPLFYGNIENVSVSSEYRIFTTSLVKNTNYFSCILQDESKLNLRQEDFAFVLESCNGIIDCTNIPSGTEPVYYQSYRQETALLSNDTPVVHARLNTLRIMKDDHTMLVIKYIPSGKELVRIPLTQYLLLSKTYMNGREMKDQEYLDRQDTYTLLFFINSSSDTGPYISPKVSVNGWTIRLNDTELEIQ